MVKVRNNVPQFSMRIAFHIRKNQIENHRPMTINELCRINDNQNEQ